MIYYLAIAAFAFPLVCAAVLIYCAFSCDGCRERQEARDAMQMKVARELQALARQERKAKVRENAIVMLVKRAKV